ncbi:DUF1697 domain-containing protein [Geothrix alkalitolerans]|uniref:DUF1697 domain-containing protein n=1 Tax=Geothrix alkalitolerans TaxID=2922724 RepID=UPI001FB01AFE|nr:DUF1697 domain-containing protein [Geothrix alkalitolerans]
MPKTFAFLRAINVGGHTVTMADLKERFQELGLQGVETFIASGNVVFEAGRAGEASLATRLEAHLEAKLGFPVAVFLRSGAELAALVAGCPFDALEQAEARAMNVIFLRASLTGTQAARLRSLETAEDDFRFHGREVWWRCRTKQSQSAFSNAVFEKALGLKATFRGLPTLQRLVAKHLS